MNRSKRINKLVEQTEHNSLITFSCFLHELSIFHEEANPSEKYIYLDNLL